MHHPHTVCYVYKRYRSDRIAPAYHGFQTNWIGKLGISQNCFPLPLLLLNLPVILKADRFTAAIRVDDAALAIPLAHPE